MKNISQTQFYPTLDAKQPIQLPGKQEDRPWLRIQKSLPNFNFKQMEKTPPKRMVGSYIFLILPFENYNTATPISNSEVITTLLESYRGYDID